MVRELLCGCRWSGIWRAWICGPRPKTKSYLSTSVTLRSPYQAAIRMQDQTIQRAGPSRFRLSHASELMHIVTAMLRIISHLSTTLRSSIRSTPTALPRRSLWRLAASFLQGKFERTPASCHTLAWLHQCFLLLLPHTFRIHMLSLTSYAMS